MVRQGGNWLWHQASATALLYEKIRPFITTLVEDCLLKRKISKKFLQTGSMPTRIFSRNDACADFQWRDLQKQIGTGTASDTGISRPVSLKLSELFDAIDKTNIPNRAQITVDQSDNGRHCSRLSWSVTAQDFVAQAKEGSGAFLREEYEHITGVVYNFRADFVIPNTDPKAFIEVRKSSAGHASLYAKDKMFSAINWR